MPEGQAEPCCSYKWAGVLRASLEHQVKSCCAWLKTGQATGSHPLSRTELKISPPATDIISVLFATQESFFLTLFFFVRLANNLFPSLRIPHEAVTFIMLQYLSSGKSLLTLPRTRVLSFTPILGHVSLLSCQWHSSATAMVRADATRASYFWIFWLFLLFLVYCHHSQVLKYEARSNVKELGTGLWRGPCFWAWEGAVIWLK